MAATAQAATQSKAAPSADVEDDLLDGADVELFKPSAGDTDLNTAADFEVIDIEPSPSDTNFTEILVQDDEVFEGFEAIPIETEPEPTELEAVEDVDMLDHSAIELVPDEEVPEETDWEDLSTGEKIWEGCGLGVVGFFVAIGAIIVLILALGHYALDFSSYILIFCAQCFLPADETRVFADANARRVYEEQYSTGDQIAYCVGKTISVTLQTGGTAAASVAMCFHAIVASFVDSFFDVEFRPDYEPVECCIEAEQVERHISVVQA